LSRVLVERRLRRARRLAKGSAENVWLSSGDGDDTLLAVRCVVILALVGAVRVSELRCRSRREPGPRVGRRPCA
jgi:hypothetical protein